VDLRIEKLVYGGDGLAHHDGRTVFVPLVLPGELVHVETSSQKKKFLRGRVDHILEASPERVAAPCPHFGRCGGCHYQHIPYEAQLRYKAEILRETLSRIGRVQWDGPIETHGSPPFGYRNRTQWKVRAGADGATGPSSIGYFEAGSTRLCAVEQCPILSPRLQEVLAALRTLIAPNKALAAIDEIEAFSDAADDKILFNLSGERLHESAAAIAAALSEALPFAESILVQDRRADKFELFGPGYLTYSAAGAQYRVGHLSFFQVNRFLVEPLVEAVTGGSRGDLALDLFAGVGLFTVPLSRQFARVIGVESNLAAAKDLEFNLQSSGGTSPAPRHATVESFLSRWHDTPDLVVLDPPRAGVAPEALARLKKLGPRRVAYLSCDPATLARDLAALLALSKGVAAYQISSINLFDIFTQTYHMEALVHLQKGA
jgi:23S rRNA (uracil1939-C5)-methyltransferase